MGLGSNLLQNSRCVKTCLKSLQAVQHCRPSHLRVPVKKLGINQVEATVELQASHGLAGDREALLLAKSGTLLLSDFCGQCFPALVPHSSQSSVLWVQTLPVTLRISGLAEEDFGGWLGAGGRRTVGSVWSVDQCHTESSLWKEAPWQPAVISAL